MAEEKYHSLVYRDTDMQKYLKDILIPLVGYRDAGHTVASFRDSIDKLKAEVLALQIPPKTKFYQQSWSLPIFIEIPEKSYDFPEVDMFEPVKVTIEFNKIIQDSDHPDNNGEWNYAFDIMIPGSCNTNQYGQPYCISCNANAYKEIKKIRIARLQDLRQNPANVYVIQIPYIAANSGQYITYTSGSVTIYSENRNVKKVESWNSVDLNDPTINTMHSWEEVTMGSIPYFDPVEDVDKLVYSEEIRWINALTLPALEYLQETGNTDPDTLYVGREDDDETYDGTIHFETVDDFKRELPVLYKIFGYNWRYLDLEFGEEVTSIDGLLEGNSSVVGAPRRIIGESITSAQNIFKNSAIQYVEDQASLFEGIPNVKHLDGAFEGCPTNINVEDAMIENLPNLVSVRRMFANTKITGFETPWLLHDGGLDGENFFYGVTTVDESELDEIPQYWKDSSKENTMEFYTRASFDRVRDEILRYREGDLHTLTIKFVNQNTNLEGLFEASSVKVSPKNIVSPGSTTMRRGFANCGELTEVTSGLFSSLNGKLQYFDEMFLNNIKLAAFPENFIIPSSIVSYKKSFSGLVLVTGQAPMISGKNLWTLAGTSGFPTKIDGTDCFLNSPFANRGEIPKTWGGDLDA